MTSPILNKISSLKDITLSNSSTYDKNYLSLSKQIKEIFNSVIPICQESVDDLGNRCRLWHIDNKYFIGTVVNSNGIISVIFPDKIINPCGGNSISALKKIKNLYLPRLSLIYQYEKEELIILPYLRAAGTEDDVISQPVSCKIKFDTRPERLGHIFRKKEGHFHEDTPENRAYILAAVSDPANKIGENKFGREIYFKKMSDGYRAWAYVENGLIKNGGRDSPWRTWVMDSEAYQGGRMVPTVTIFREQIQIDRLTDVFNSTITERYWEPHPLETVTTARDVGGVRHETGIIVDLLEELKSSQYNDYLFFIPETEGPSS